MALSRPQLNPTLPRRAFLAAFLAITSITAAAGVFFYRDQQRYYTHDLSQQLTSIAQLKTAALVSWRDGIAADAEVFRNNPEFVSDFKLSLASPESADSEEARARVAAWLKVIRSKPGYNGAYLLDESGVIVDYSVSSLRSDDAHISDIAANFVRTNQIGFVDLHRHEDGTVRLAVVAPLPGISQDSRPVGALVVAIDPQAYLFPYLNEWPVPSETGETLLVRRDGTDALVLNEARFARDSALNRRIPLVRTALIPTKAVLGERGIVEGFGVGGIREIAYVAKVPDTPWYLISQISRAEATARLTTRLWLVAAVVALLISGVGGITMLLWRDQRLKQFAAQLKAERERSWLRNIIERAMNEIYVFDRESLRFLFVNAGAIRNLGYDLHELEMMTPVDIESTYTEQSYRSAIAPLASDELQRLHFETVHTRKDGTRYPVEVHLQQVDSDFGPVYLAVIDDITERREAEDEILRYQDHLEEMVALRTKALSDANTELDKTNEDLQRANVTLEATVADLEDANATKSAFLACMSHELRTPLNSIIGFSGILAQGLAGPLNDEQLTQIEMVNRSGNHLLALINDVLDLTKVESGKVDLQIECFDAHEALTLVVDAMRPAAAEKGLVLNVSFEGETSLYSDCGKVSQILFNMIGNAIKFTDSGHVDARYGRTADGNAIFAITDTGIGIQQKDLDRVFETFTQLHAPQVGKPKGTGLGLALSQEYAGLLGGRISVVSTVGHGSTFTLLLPAETSEC